MDGIAWIPGATFLLPLRRASTITAQDDAAIPTTRGWGAIVILRDPGVGYSPARGPA